MATLDSAIDVVGVVVKQTSKILIKALRPVAKKFLEKVLAGEGKTEIRKLSNDFTKEIDKLVGEKKLGGIIGNRLKEIFKLGLLY